MDEGIDTGSDRPGGDRRREADFDLDQLVALCRWCHDQTDAPYERGRLVVTASGAGQFTFEVVKLAGRKSAALEEPWIVPTWAK
jgi:hypothetical protein